MTAKNDAPCLAVPKWQEHEGLVATFFGREGGASAPPFQSLNGSYDLGDDFALVRSNWCIAKETLGLADFPVTSMTQVHGHGVRFVTPDTGKEAGACDALLTDAPNCFLAIRTADCVPVFLIDPERRAAGAVHAGWRGAVAGIVSLAVERMADAFGSLPGKMMAALGPSIRECCYEIGEEVAEQVSKKQPEFAQHVLRARGSRIYLDLPELVRWQLEAAGLSSGRISFIGACTACHTDRYFSHRAENGRTGRQMSIVGWRLKPDSSAPSDPVKKALD